MNGWNSSCGRGHRSAGRACSGPPNPRPEGAEAGAGPPRTPVSLGSTRAEPRWQRPHRNAAQAPAPRPSLCTFAQNYPHVRSRRGTWPWSSGTSLTKVDTGPLSWALVCQPLPQTAQSRTKQTGCSVVQGTRLRLASQTPAGQARWGPPLPVGTSTRALRTESLAEAQAKGPWKGAGSCPAPHHRGHTQKGRPRAGLDCPPARPTHPRAHGEQRPGGTQTWTEAALVLRRPVPPIWTGR